MNSLKKPAIYIQMSQRYTTNVKHDSQDIFDRRSAQTKHIAYILELVPFIKWWPQCRIMYSIQRYAILSYIINKAFYECSCLQSQRSGKHNHFNKSGEYVFFCEFVVLTVSESRCRMHLMNLEHKNCNMRGPVFRWVCLELVKINRIIV